MKRLIAFLGLLFATAALAADNPIGCSGASCKIVLQGNAASATTVQVKSTASNQNAQIQFSTATPAQAWNIGQNITLNNGSFEIYNSTGSLTAATTTTAGQWTLGSSAANTNLQSVYAGGGLTNYGRGWTMTAAGSQTEVVSTVPATTTNYSTVFTDLTTTARNVAGGIAIGNAQVFVTITNPANKGCAFAYATQIEAGVIHHFSSHYGNTCTVSFNGTSTYTLTGLGDAKTYTYACSTATAVCQISVSSVNTGSTNFTLQRFNQ